MLLLPQYSERTKREISELISEIIYTCILITNQIKIIESQMNKIIQ